MIGFMIRLAGAIAGVLIAAPILLALIAIAWVMTL